MTLSTLNLRVLTHAFYGGLEARSSGPSNMAGLIRNALPLNRLNASTSAPQQRVRHVEALEREVRLDAVERPAQ